MTIREQSENNEKITLSKYATLSILSKGRKIEEEPCQVRTCFCRDRDRILHSKSFRRLKRKTQVFLSPEGDHFRTRLTHTLEVSQIARTIARACNLNEDLTEAIALGHDLGHTPFGHAGEAALNKINGIGFTHYEQSVRVVELLERDFKGLNLTFEVIDGIKNHTKGQKPQTLEGKIVRYSDKIAYLSHDIEDAISGGVLNENSIPTKISDILGKTKSQRITTMVTSIIENSIIENSGNDIIMGENIRIAYKSLQDFMFENVYLNPVAKKEEKKVFGLINSLFDYFKNNINKMPENYVEFLKKISKTEDNSIERVVTDYIAGMTDSYAISLYSEIFIPRGWKV